MLHSGSLISYKGSVVLIGTDRCQFNAVEDLPKATRSASGSEPFVKVSNIRVGFRENCFGRDLDLKDNMVDWQT